MVISTPSVCLTFAGFDPSLGAGITADIAVFNALEVSGFAICTGITFQNALKFGGVEWSTTKVIENQLHALDIVLTDVKAVKIGLVDSMDMLGFILSLKPTYFPNAVVVWDPILSTSSGFQLHQFEHELNTDVLLGIDFLTPNKHEAEYLFGLKESTPINGLIITSFHVAQEDVTDKLMWNDEVYYATAKIKGVDKKGTGCRFSAAFAAEIAKGSHPFEALQVAQNLVGRYRANKDL